MNGVLLSTIELLDLIDRLGFLLDFHGLTAKLFLGAVIGHIDYHLGCRGGNFLCMLVLRARCQIEVDELRGEIGVSPSFHSAQLFQLQLVSLVRTVREKILIHHNLRR